MRLVWKRLTWLTSFAAVFSGSLSSSVVAEPAHSLLRSSNTQLRQQGPGRVQSKIEDGYVPVDDGIRLFYRKVGDGDDTVVVPLGFYLYKDFKQLARNRTVIFYDMRNRGRSSAVSDGEKITIQKDVEDLEKIRQHFGLGRMNLMGESYLGLMVIMYAMKYPDHVARIVQIAAVPLKFGTEYPANLTANDVKPVPDPVDQEKLNQLRKAGYDKSHPREFCEKDWVVSRTMLVGNPANARKISSPCAMPNEWPVNFDRHLQFHFASVQRLNIAKEEVSRVSAPVLTIHGTKDRNAPYGGGREWALMLPNARLLTITGAAHFPWVDEPETVFRSIDVFLRGKWPATTEKVQTIEK
jgi:pimeloyl-ACP methyl ester carboxylesterase